MLDQAREDAAENVKRAEADIREIEKTRSDAHERHYQQMRELQKKHEEEKKKLRDEEMALRQESINERRRQFALETKQQLDHLDELSKHFQQVHVTTSTKAVIKEFLGVMAPTVDAQKSLKTLSDSCLDNSYSKAEIEIHLRSFNLEKLTFTDKARNFEYFLLNSQNVHREVITLSKFFIKQYRTIMESNELVTLWNRLPKAVRNDEQAKIMLYGENASNVANKLEAVGDQIEPELNKLEQQFVAAPPVQGALGK